MGSPNANINSPGDRPTTRPEGKMVSEGGESSKEVKHRDKESGMPFLEPGLKDKMKSKCKNNAQRAFLAFSCLADYVLQVLMVSPHYKRNGRLLQPMTALPQSQTHQHQLSITMS